MDGVRVFVANFSGHDYTEAEAYGKVRFLTKGFISFDNLDRVKYQIAEAVNETRSDDWLLLSGVNIINVLAAVIWYAKHGVVKMLNYDRNEGKYNELIMTADHLHQLTTLIAEA